MLTRVRKRLTGEIVFRVSTTETVGEKLAKFLLVTAVGSVVRFIRLLIHV